MEIVNISKEPQMATVQLTSGELVDICNALYATQENKSAQFHKLNSELMLARDLSQYGHVDDFCLQSIMNQRNLYNTRLKRLQEERRVLV